MAAITNSEAVRFCNERIRVAANKLNAAYKYPGTELNHSATCFAVEGSPGRILCEQRTKRRINDGIRRFNYRTETER